MIEKILENNEKWIAEKLELSPNYFDELGKGQNPDLLYIGCSDSRVTAEDMMGVGPGDVFVHRNIANMVSNLDLSSASVINYAVNFLKVKHIIICGHYACGGVQAAMNSQDLGLLNPWLRNIRDVYRIHKDELNAIENEAKRYDRFVELNVQEQCVNVMKVAEVQTACRKENLKVHGWVFDVHTGRIIDLKIDTDRILDGIREIYHLD